MIHGPVRYLIGVAGIVVIRLAFAEVAAAQVCLQSSDASTRYIAHIRRDVADTTDLAAIGLQAVPDTAVSLITDEAICTSALAAYTAVRQPQWGSGPPESVYVIRAGAERYVVIDPLTTRHYTIFAVFDTGWQFLAAIGG